MRCGRRDAATGQRSEAARLHGQRHPRSAPNHADQQRQELAGEEPDGGDRRAARLDAPRARAPCRWSATPGRAAAGAGAPPGPRSRSVAKPCSCWISASATSIGSLVAVASRPASAIASSRSARPAPLARVSAPIRSGPRSTTVGPACSAAKRTLKTPMETAVMPTSHARPEQRANRQPGRRQQGEQAEQHDAGGHGVERREQRDQDDERRRPAWPPGSPSPAGAPGPGRSASAAASAPAAQLERPIGQRVDERAVMGRERDPAPGVA